MRDRQRLQPAAGERHQVLLQWLDAERVFDLELGHFAVGAFRKHEETVVLAGEPRGDAAVRKFRIVEIAEHGFIGRDNS
jgi:hypothetical protein